MKKQFLFQLSHWLPIKDKGNLGVGLYFDPAMTCNFYKVLASRRHVTLWIAKFWFIEPNYIAKQFAKNYPSKSVECQIIALSLYVVSIMTKVQQTGRLTFYLCIIIIYHLIPFLLITFLMDEIPNCELN